MPKQDKNPFINLKKLLEEELQLVDNIILDNVKSYIPLIPDVAKHTLKSGGKRLRPLLTLASYKLCNKLIDEKSASLAASVELMHTATLLHDDVVDDGKIRRGNITAHLKWGNKESILVGDFLLGRAFHLMAPAQSLEIYKILSDAAMTISEGEILQMSLENNLNISFEDYIQVITAKTAALFAAACEVSSLINKDTHKLRKNLYNFGLNLGIAYQIADDIIDYKLIENEENNIDKTKANDFFEGKITLPVMLAYKNSNIEQKDFWHRTLRGKNYKQEDAKLALNILKSTNSLEEAEKIAQYYINEAKEALNIFENSTIKQQLINMLEFINNRNF